MTKARITFREITFQMIRGDMRTFTFRPDARGANLKSFPMAQMPCKAVREKMPTLRVGKYINKRFVPQINTRSEGSPDKAMHAQCCKIIERHLSRQTSSYIVTIALLLVLVEIVRPRFIVRPEKAGQTAARAQIAAFNTALQLYKLEHESLPSSLDELIVNESGRNFLSDTPQLPKDPWGNPYRYTHPCANEHEYEIISLGADGAPGGSYDNADIVSWDLTSSYSFNMRR